MKEERRLIKNLPLFPVQMIGSWPRKPEILSEILKATQDDFDQQALDKLVYPEVKNLVKLEEEIGMDIVGDGELNRDSYASYVAQRYDGIKLMDMLEFTDYLGPDCDFAEQIINNASIKLSAIKNAVCVGKLGFNEGLVVKDLKHLRELTDKPIKVQLPGPYLLARSIWVPRATQPHYNSQEELADAIVELLTQEVQAIQDIGVEVIQFDEPVLTEVVFSEESTAERTFMCSSLSEKRSRQEELEFATGLIKRVMDSVDRTKSYAALHSCRGNWGTDESALLSGPYTPLIPTFETIKPDILNLEFSVRRAGELKDLFTSDYLRENIILGLGVVNPRSKLVERTSNIVLRAKEALEYIPKERLWLNPDCGFGTFSNSPISSYDMAANKLKAIVQAAQILREEYQ